jgi:hypothetical protein
MIDLVYPLGRGSKWGNAEIRYSLRSVEKYSLEDGYRVFVVGEKPICLDWKKVIHIPFTEGKAKEINILEKALAAAKDERVSEEFFFINDDYFFLQPFSLTEFPYYHKGNIRTQQWGNTPDDKIRNVYDRMVKMTADKLERDGFGTFHYDIHTPHRLLKRWVVAAYERYKHELPRTERGLACLTTILNSACVAGTHKTDTKLHGKELGWLKKNKDKELMFSIFDTAQTGEFKAYMDTLYPDKSYFEA